MNTESDYFVVAADDEVGNDQPSYAELRIYAYLYPSILGITARSRSRPHAQMRTQSGCLTKLRDLLMENNFYMITSLSKDEAAFCSQ